MSQNPERRIWQHSRSAHRLFYSAVGLLFLAMALWLGVLGLMGLTVNAVFLGGKTLSDVT
ncbi:MAG: hypothetical protein IAF02_14520, partial [Anaerolineae bacterium]|nr:hypothetical protein [Anaerolineae bacterium]